MIPSFAGKIVEVMRWDYGFRLWTDDNWEILVEGPFVVTATGELPIELDPNGVTGDLPDALRRFQDARITELLVAEEGHLGITFDQAQLSVRARPRFESWQVAGRDGERLICMPGGELAYFPPVRVDRGTGDRG